MFWADPWDVLKWALIGAAASVPLLAVGLKVQEWAGRNPLRLLMIAIVAIFAGLFGYVFVVFLALRSCITSTC